MPKARTKNQLGDWVSRLRESSHDVVLAGLASLSRTYRAEEPRTEADFDTLVAEGRRLEPELQEAARRVWSEWVGKAGRNKPSQAGGRLQGVFDERVMAVLVRLGVPSAEDLADLRAKVDRLLERDGVAQGPEPGTRQRAKVHGRAGPRRHRSAPRQSDGQGGRRRTARG